MIRFGEPSAIDPSPGGIAIWKRDKLGGTCINRVEVRDEAIPHANPVNHYDFVYIFADYPIAPSKLVDIIDLSSTIGYDQGKNELWCRCGTIDAAVATMALATQVGEGHISLNYAQANDLLNHYLTASQDPNQTSRLYDLLCYNLKHAIAA